MESVESLVSSNYLSVMCSMDDANIPNTVYHRYLVP